jgi:hypothetical protein
MTMRSIALFAHLVGMLALFAGLAVEWLCVERLRAPDEPGPPMFTVRVLERLPRVTGIAVALILLSGYRWLRGSGFSALHSSACHHTIVSQRPAPPRTPWRSGSRHQSRCTASAAPQ